MENPTVDMENNTPILERTLISTNPVANNASISDPSTVAVLSPDTRDDFDTFHKFRELPVELRLAIWYLAIPQNCLIELVSVLLRVNRESREVAMKHYTLKEFHPAVPQPDPKNRVYYNPQTDIIFLNSTFCHSTIRSFIELIKGIERVTFMATANYTCCNVNAYKQVLYDYGFDKYEFKPIQLLHGFHPTKHQRAMIEAAGRSWEWFESQFPGCKGLKDIYIVKPSLISPVAIGQADCMTRLRPAGGHGVSELDFEGARMLQHTVKNVRHGVYKWAGDSKPNIEYISLSRGDSNLGPYDTIEGTVVTHDQRAWLLANDAVTTIEKDTRCQITIFPHAYDFKYLIWDTPKLYYEVGIRGPRKGVELAKERLSTQQSLADTAVT